MTVTKTILLIFFLVLKNSCQSEEIQWNEEDNNSDYKIEDSTRITDWDCWYNDYYQRVDRCNSKTVSSTEHIKCKQYRGCKRYCTSIYGSEQCRVHCKLKTDNLAKFIKVVYRVRQDGNCKNSVICVYKSECNGLWPKYINQGCYYTQTFSQWWLKHRKEYAKPRISNRSTIPSTRKIYSCLNNMGRYPKIDPSLEIKIQFRQSHGKMYYKIGQIWFEAKLIDGKLFFLIGEKQIPVKFTGKHHFWKIGEKWLKIAGSREKIYGSIQNSWIELKVLSGKEYFRLGQKWVNLRFSNGNVEYKCGKKWIGIKILQNDFYGKISGKWYQVKFGRHFNLVKINGNFRKIKFIEGSNYIKLAKRWFGFKIKKGKYYIKFDQKWTEIEFDKLKNFILIKNIKYPVLFKFTSVYIQINNQWIQVEYKNKEIFFKINKNWMHFSLIEDRLFFRKEKKMIKISLNNKRNVLYRSSASGKLKPLKSSELKSGKYFSGNKFSKVENSLKMQLFHGNWLPFKKENGNSFFFQLSGQWLKLKEEDNKLFYQTEKKWIEFVLIGKTEFNRIQGHWVRVKRENDKFYFFDLDSWHQIKLTGRHLSVDFNGSWKSFAFLNGKKFIRLGNRFSQLEFSKGNQTKFSLKMGGKFYKLMSKENLFYIKLDSDWKQVEFYPHRPVNVLLDNVWLPVTFKDRKLYVKNGNCWLETILKGKVLFVRIGDSFHEIKISSNKKFHVKISGGFFKLIERNEIEFNKLILKVNFINEKLHIFLSGNWLPFRFEKDRVLVKVTDSWMETKIDDKEHLAVELNDQKVRLTFENGILCEKYDDLNVPINVRFGQLYYNLNGKWVKVYPRDDLRFIKLNRNLVKLDREYLIDKIRKYKLKLKLRCVLFAGNQRHWTKLKSRLKGDSRRSVFQRFIGQNRWKNPKMYETVDMMHKPKPADKNEIILK